MKEDNLNNTFDDIVDFLILIFPKSIIALTATKFGIKSLFSIINYINEREVYYVIKEIKKNYENNMIYSNLENDDEFVKNRNKLNKRFEENPEFLIKKIYNSVRNISEEEKTNYLINLYTKLVCGHVNYEDFTNASSFLEKANIYEIKFAIKLFNKEEINEKNGYFYIIQLVNYNLIDARYGVLNGPSTNPNDYDLNNNGIMIIKSII